MSADRWSICPQCKVELEAQKEYAKDLAERSYGLVSAEEYEQLRGEAAKPLVLEATVRQDYEFYLRETGEFYAGFQARCNTCDFSFAFKHEEQLELRQLVD